MRTVQIYGAGPAGLAAAITVARRGGRAVVHEKAGVVGHRFHDDYEGIESWTTEYDTLQELQACGLAPSFECTTFHRLLLYDTRGRGHWLRSSQPLFYLVRRGPAEGSLDRGLWEQARDLGVEFRFKSYWRPGPQAAEDGGIATFGPRRSDVVALGCVFDTDPQDGAYVAVSNRLAPWGYAYLLMHGGRGTLSVCLFDDVEHRATYLERSMAFFQKTLGLSIRNPRPYGGWGAYQLPHSARLGNLLFAGEGAGFQDALWGFGMRHAMLSGHYAAVALMADDLDLYDRLWQPRLRGNLYASLVNRYLWQIGGDLGYDLLAANLGRASDARQWLRWLYAPAWWKAMLWPLARRGVWRDGTALRPSLKAFDREPVSS